MTPIDRFERALPAALTDLAEPHVPDYFIDVLGQTARTRQRPAWASLERWLPMDLTTQRVPVVGLPWRHVGLVALLILLLVAAAVIVVGSQRITPAPLFGPAQNGYIPYALDGDIHVGDPDTGATTALLTGPTYDTEPMYSRDGTKIAFERWADPSAPESLQLMVMDADGSNVRQVTSTPPIELHWWDWAPDGSALVIVDTVGSERSFQLLDIDGDVPPRTLADGLGVDVPVFRPPDSRQILFRGQTDAGIGLYVMAADGSGITPLIEPATSDNPDFTLREPRWSPDGTQIAFQQWDDATGTMRLYVMNAGGTGRRELGADPDIWFTGWPVWSNDGTRLAVGRGRRSVAEANGFAVPTAIVDIRNGAVTETGPVMPEQGARMEWSPDDTRLLIRPNLDTGARQSLLDPAGGRWEELPWQAGSYPNWQRLAD